MKLVFRCDAGLEYGLGHFSRCMVLANSLMNKGGMSRFVINAPEYLFKRILNEGHQVQQLPNSLGIYENPLEWVGDADVVLLDSPKITKKYLWRVGSNPKVCMFDDDIARNYEVDLIINNHPWASIADYKNNDSKKGLLLGTLYNTVNPLYFKKYENRYGLLVTMGGEDPENITSWIIRELAELKVQMPITIIVGPAHPNPLQVNHDAKRYLPFADLNFSPKTLEPFIKKSHIAITAGGTTCYELAASKIPFAVFALEKSQIKLSKAVVGLGFGLSIGDYNEISREKFQRGINLLEVKEVFDLMREKAEKIYPESGVDRIAEHILAM